jgi:hypothetical protein
LLKQEDFLVKSLMNTLVLSLLISSLANAQSIVGAYDLALTEYSDTSAISMKMIEYDDGRIKLLGTGSHSVLSGPIEFKYEVNTDTREVTVTTSPLFVLEESLELDKITAMSGDMSKIGELYTAQKESGTRMPQEGGWYWASMRLRTKDPVFIVLAQTWLRIDYYVQGPQRITYAALSKDYWANPDTAFGTEWFVGSTSSSGPTIWAGNFEANASLHGEYYNWDYLDDELITTSVHDLDLTVRSKTSILTYTWEVENDGEHAVLLTGWVAFNYPTSAH